MIPVSSSLLASFAGVPKRQVPLGPAVRAPVASGAGCPRYCVSAAEPMPRNAQEPGKCPRGRAREAEPGRAAAAPPVARRVAHVAQRYRVDPRSSQSAPAELCALPGPRRLRGRQRGPRPGPGFPRTRPPRVRGR